MAKNEHTLKAIADAATQKRPRYFNDPATDELLAIVLELAEDNCVLRDRLQSAEAISTGINRLIDDYNVSEQETQERLDAHSETMNTLFGRIAELVEK